MPLELDQETQENMAALDTSELGLRTTDIVDSAKRLFEKQTTTDAVEGVYGLVDGWLRTIFIGESADHPLRHRAASIVIRLYADSLTKLRQTIEPEKEA